MRKRVFCPCVDCSVVLGQGSRADREARALGQAESWEPKERLSGRTACRARLCMSQEGSGSTTDGESQPQGDCDQKEDGSFTVTRAGSLTVACSVPFLDLGEVYDLLYFIVHLYGKLSDGGFHERLFVFVCVFS